MPAGTKRCRSLAQRPTTRHNEVEFPGRAKPPHLGDQLQQHGLGAAELVGRTDERDSHQLAGFRAQRTTWSENRRGKCRASAFG